jgi:hypothetical protein
MTTARKWDRIRKQVRGYVRGLEVTWGGVNGWHPHLHVLFFIYPEHCPTEFYATLRQWWDKAVIDAGGDSDFDVATKLTWDYEDISTYLTKWGIGEEMTRGQMSKTRDRGLTPFEILGAYGISCAEQSDENKSPAMWAVLYREYLRCFKGKRQLTWSRQPNIRQAANIAEEKSEADIVEGEEAGYTLLARLTHEHWKAIVYCGARGAILDAAADGDAGVMEAILIRCVTIYQKNISDIT